MFEELIDRGDDNVLEIMRRWRGCQASDRLLAWHSMHFWLAAEARMANLNFDFPMSHPGLLILESELMLLSDIALQRALLLQPIREEE